MPKSSPIPRLRVKTGCQTCRRRKKKCDEGRPICRRCAVLGWNCEWPTSEDLVDRRCMTAQKLEIDSKHIATSKEILEKQQYLDDTQLCLTSASIAQRAASQHIKPIVSKHFADKYYNLILLPNCSSEFYWSMFNELEHVLPGCRSLQYTILANAASHIHSIIKSARMQELALTYYSQALRSMQELLDTNPRLENHNGLLLSVILLYTLGSTGQETHKDTPRHINAAVKIVALRHFNIPAAISSPFDRLVLESVLLSMFLTSMGLWSEEFNTNGTFDLAFWLAAERLLAQESKPLTVKAGINAPVLGVPVALLKLLLLVRQIRPQRELADQAKLRDLKLEISQWEAHLIGQSLDSRFPPKGEITVGPPNTRIVQDSSTLFIIVASILMEQILVGDANDTCPSTRDQDCWRKRYAMSILRTYQHDETWSRFFTTTMAVYTLGFFVSHSREIDLVRKDLQSRWDVTNFGHIIRYRRDLDAVWAKRGFVEVDQNPN
ncbi:hypothetical protein LTR84_010503 [Exophiala bonariae]|uniref:Zn(2)-C6 fungal-type domain-containing protein n=1 Tax=Exophiala bonariae TaxID=1690606 RepID=A0AAV9MVV2_9EURO|nr:hypothetical protein LTR84_010503 [Exophiala bonariae]